MENFKKSEISYIFNNLLNEITFLVNLSKDDLDIKKLQNELYISLNTNSNCENIYSENGVVYPIEYYVRINKSRFNYDYYICVYNLDFDHKMNYDYIIEIIEKTFGIKAIKY